MIMKKNSSSQTSNRTFPARSGERGAALAAALLLLALLSAIAVTVLAVVTTETRIAGSDLKRTQTFYCAAAGIEKMTSDYSALFRESARPTDTQIASVKDAPPAELVTLEGFNFVQTIVKDTATLTTMQETQGITDVNQLPTVTLPGNSPYVGLLASVKPYILTSRCYQPDNASVTLTRTMNNYLIPLFQFGMFSDNDIELHPGADFVFNGRVHANGNIYLAGKVALLDKVTSAHEVIYDYQRNGEKFTAVTNDVWMGVGALETKAPLTKGSIEFGPHIASTCTDPDGTGPLPPVGVNCFPTAKTGTPWSTFNWHDESLKPAATGVANNFGGQLLTRVTGAAPLKLPMELDGNPTREIIKRRLPTDNKVPLPPADETSPLSDSRYHSKAGIRILIDDENVTTDGAGINAAQNGDGTNNKGVNLSGTTYGAVPGFDPIPLPNSAASAGGRALWRVKDDGTYIENTTNCPFQANAGTPAQALTVRGSRATTQSATTPAGSTIAIPKIPGGAGLSGHILIQIEDKDGVWRDVTKEILSMGMTVGEPNAIVHLQRPLWAAFTQGSRDSSGSAGTNNLTDMVKSTLATYIPADGEIRIDDSPIRPAQDATYGFLTKIEEDSDASGAHPLRADTPPPICATADWADGGTDWYDKKCWNAIVPINIYNVREGRISTNTSSPYDKTEEENAVYERGITSVVEINMENLARWMDGVYDTNLLAGTSAVSGNIKNPDGFIVYVSDRRGDNSKSMTLPKFGSSPVVTSTFNATNGMDDNVDIYGPNDIMDDGENVQETSQKAGDPLVKDLAELPDPVDDGNFGNPTTLDERTKRALNVAAWTNGSNYFRRAVRLFNAEDLQTSKASPTLSLTKGITIASENMVYTWGNYNTTGINQAPAAGKSSLNDSAEASHYMPVSVPILCVNCDRQVPASIVSDAWFPLSKTWFDSSSALYPDDLSKRYADLSVAAVTDETSVRTGIIAGNNLSAIEDQPDAGNDANHESRLNGGMHNFPRFLEFWNTRFNFAANSKIYDPPIRNWAFDITFTNPLRLPPGTPMFQHIEPTGFKQVL